MGRVRNGGATKAMVSGRLTQGTDIVPADAGGSSSRLGPFARLMRKTPVPFTIQLPDGTTERFGEGPGQFQVILTSEAGLKSLLCLDEGRFGDAWLAGDIEVEGDLLRMFALRGLLKDFHPGVTLWRFLQPLLMGQVRTNKAAISNHYDLAPEFYLSFMDPAVPCYTQALFLDDAEPLAVAATRKFDYAFEKLGLNAGDHMLEVGPGWGAWFEYCASRGVKCTGITISQSSADYLNGRAKELGYDWEIIMSDLLDFPTDKKYDAVAMMGIIEHLPDYDVVLAKLSALVKPGRCMFIDGSACTRKYELSSYMVKYIYPGNHSFLVLHDFLGALAKTKLSVQEIFNDRHSYFLTFQHWARNFDANKDFVVSRFGTFNFRRFRLYLWGSAYEFLSRSLDCYRMVIRVPDA
jgi:cyclopropane-fatty-acyl-phospholipid synthase